MGAYPDHFHLDKATGKASFYRGISPAPKPFRSWLGFDIANQKYLNGSTWEDRMAILGNEVTEDYLSRSERIRLIRYMSEMKFIPGGRYLYYAGREMHAYNNCFCYIAQEDTREEWCRLTHDAMSALMMGGGIGIDYSVFREQGALLSRTGGTASGPIPLMHIMNEVGRNVMQGGSRRSAMYASLLWTHADIFEFIDCKDWTEKVKAAKAADFNYPAPMDMTNISVNLDDEFFMAIQNEDHELYSHANKVADRLIHSMLTSAEPGVSINIGEESKHTGRNACAEYISDQDSDVCNLGSANMSRIKTLTEFKDVCYLGAKFLYSGGLKADLPTEAVRATRAKRMSIGLGIMGVHEWLIKTGCKYEQCEELHDWLQAYEEESERGANDLADELGTVRSARYRAIAPTGTIGMVAGTTTGIEPLFAVAEKRRYLTDGENWTETTHLAPLAELLIREGVDPYTIETAMDLAEDPERRIKFQAWVQQYVDMGISSTLNLPAYEQQTFTEGDFKKLMIEYGPRLRGMTCYPDGSRGGQPLTAVSLDDVLKDAPPQMEVAASC